MSTHNIHFHAEIKKKKKKHLSDTQSYLDLSLLCKNKTKKAKLKFVFLQKHRGLPPFWCHIVLYIQQTFILTNESPREITQKV